MTMCVLVGVQVSSNSSAGVVSGGGGSQFAPADTTAPAAPATGSGGGGGGGFSLNFSRPGSRTTSAPSSPSKTRESFLQVSQYQQASLYFIVVVVVIGVEVLSSESYKI